MKAHASPAFYAIQYLRGRLERGRAARAPELRRAAGLSEPPQEPGDRRHLDRVDGTRRGAGHLRRAGHALSRRSRPRPPSPERVIVMVGDAELDEGNVWEALAEEARRPARQRAVDRRRQPPEPRPHRPRRAAPPAARAVPDLRLERDRAALWLEAAGRSSSGPGGKRLRARLDTMPYAEYQSLLRLPAGRGAQGAGDRGERRDRPRARSPARARSTTMRCARSSAISAGTTSH